MHRPTINRLVSLSVLAVSLSGCALFPNHHWWWAKNKPVPIVKPVPIPAAAPQYMADDGLYADAVKAVSNRDYASALDMLQAARARNADDPRVWNAFGVVYDKLGRFDLSPRYYARAESLDPGSPIVANNRAYSLLMQGKPAPGAATTGLAQAAPLPAAVAPAAVRPAAGKSGDVEVAVVTAGADLSRGRVGTP
jgi:Flp pilus assembly protein TadD